MPRQLLNRSRVDGSWRGSHRMGSLRLPSLSIDIAPSLSLILLAYLDLNDARASCFFFCRFLAKCTCASSAFNDCLHLTSISSLSVCCTLPVSFFSARGTPLLPPAVSLNAFWRLVSGRQFNYGLNAKRCELAL